MRKLSLLLAVVLVISMPLTAFAAVRNIDIEPELSFNGTTANCNLVVLGNNASEHIEVTMKLMNGYYCVASWQAEGYGYLQMQKTALVTKGCTYTLVIEITINDVFQPPYATTKTC